MNFYSNNFLYSSYLVGLYFKIKLSTNIFAISNALERIGWRNTGPNGK